MSSDDEEIRALVAELHALMDQARPIVEALAGRPAADPPPGPDETDTEEGDCDEP